MFDEFDNVVGLYDDFGKRQPVPTDPDFTELVDDILADVEALDETDFDHPPKIDPQEVPLFDKCGGRWVM